MRLLLPIILCLTLPLSVAATSDDALFQDTFKGGLAPGWSWAREDKAAWRLADGALQIRRLPGNLWEKDNTAKNLLLRPPPKDVDTFTTEVTVSHVPTTFGDQAGLLWYRDDDNYVKLVKEWYDGRTWAVLAVERDGKAEYKEADCRAEWVAFRLTVNGDQVSAAFRPVGGTDWKSFETRFSFPAKDARIGLTAHHGPADQELWASFTDFRITGSK